MNRRWWAVGVTAAAALAAALTIGIVHAAQQHYEEAFALRMARTTATYIAAVTPAPPPAPPPRAVRVPRGRRPPPPPPPPPPLSAGARSYDLPSLLTQARSLHTLPGWSSDVEVYFGTAPLVDATAAPLSPGDLLLLETTGEQLRDGAALADRKSVV